MKKLILLFSVLVFSKSVFGQLIVPDSTFNNTGVKNFNFFNNIDRSFGCIAQPDNKLVIAGLSKNNGTGSFELCFARFLTSGNLDSTFGTNGTTKVSMGNQGSIGGLTPKLKLGPENKIIAVNSGRGPSSNSQDIMVCRLDSSGAIDLSFNSTGSLFIDMTGAGTQPDVANALDIDSVGNIYMVGACRTGSSPLDNDFAFVKVKSNGQLDSTFDADGKKLFNPSGFAEFGTGVKVQKDGKIIFGGTAGSSMYIVRVDSAGNYDTSFNGTGKLQISFSPYASMNDLVIDSLERILITGIVGTNIINISRYLPTGKIDSSFATNGKCTFTLANQGLTVSTLLVIPGQKILFSGSVDNASTGLNFYVARLDSAGILDTSFNSSGYFTKNVATGNVDDENGGMAFLSDERIFLNGTSVFSSAINEDIALMLLKPTTPIITGIKENNINPNSLLMYPNPGGNTVSYVSNLSDVILIYNEMGQLQLKLNVLVGENKFDFSSLAKGMYFIKSEKRNISIKFIKE